MKVVVNDANILIDLIELGLIKHFFRLELEFLTTSLVFEELLDAQSAELSVFVSSGLLSVQEMTADELGFINAIQKKKPALSMQDCSAFYQAKIREGILITSDNALRKFAKAGGVGVHGHLWVFDRLYEAGILTGAESAAKLAELRESVNRHLGLPAEECSSRVEKWLAGPH